ncbi:MAG: outer membrane lipid asymmetry maintenance protein MlaD [Aestuariivirga sp.]|uniref:outer membrane lipid asymmetry maintenance protein MlaD n=1 Tax=Aestuariivirga sp. TaxID=2650926 RepID=UPI003015D6AD
MKNSTVETLIGAAVIIIAAAFFFFAYQTSGKGHAAGAYRVSAEFDNAEGVSVGTDVRVAGVKIGSVVDFTLNPENFQANVVMELDPKVKFTDDATAKVTAEGLLGSKFIALEQGGSDALLADGGVISNTQGAVDIWSLISQAMFANKGSGDQGSTPSDGSDQGAGNQAAPEEGVPSTDTKTP